MPKRCLRFLWEILLEGSLEDLLERDSLIERTAVSRVYFGRLQVSTKLFCTREDGIDRWEILC